ncbi:pyruvate dehydrogenase complex dihydrolipoamide acetyltransferase, partial [Salinisphaera sp. PC39]|uniref:2-oxo acid dehydrogenase subunit E2 n=1 Tax=Salinisphaera sp. PC39 TaxID=1304156 RepID=UPI0033424074
EGDKVAEGDVICVLEDAGTSGEEQAESKQGEAPASEPAPAQEPQASEAEQAPAAEPTPEQPETRNAKPEKAPEKPVPTAAPEGRLPAVDEGAFAKAHASPAVRKFARELGVDLGRVEGSGPKGRIRKEDVQGYVKGAVRRAESAPAGGGDGLPAQPEVDYGKFGEVETVPMSRIRKLSAKHLHRSWLVVPHVTQFDAADITDLEAFRKDQKARAEREGVKLTLLAFLLKAAGAALEEFPDLNSALAADGENLIRRKFCHIGVAVDTEGGLVVPVIRDVDRKSVFEIAADLGDVSERARAGKLKREDLEGGCFSISSLGGIGGTAFTPIVNAPEVAILGVSRAETKPVWRDGEFVPRLMLPLSLSYDHRVIDGAVAARITTFLSEVLGDIRKLLL